MDDILKTPAIPPREDDKEVEEPKSDGTCPVHDCGARGPSWKCTCHIGDDEFRREN